MNDHRWQARFQNNQIGMRRRPAIEKNAVLTLGWLEYRRAEDILKEFLRHEQPVLRMCAAWSLGRLRTRGARSSLERKYREEPDRNVREEIELSIQGM